MAEHSVDLETLAKACAIAEPQSAVELDQDPWQQLSFLVDRDAQAALVVVFRATELTEDLHRLSSLGAGPIEELLQKHPATLDAVLLEARRSPNFRKAFRCVWTSGMSPAVKNKVDEALQAYGGNLLGPQRRDSIRRRGGQWRGQGV